MRRGKSPKAKTEDARLQAEAVRLADEGMTEREMAAAMGVPRSTARRLLGRALRAMVLPDAAERRKEHVRRLERLYEDLAASGGDPQAASAIVRLLDREAKLLGLDAPTKTQDVTEKPLKDMTEAELRAELARLPGGGKAS